MAKSTNSNEITKFPKVKVGIVYHIQIYIHPKIRNCRPFWVEQIDESMGSTSAGLMRPAIFLVKSQYTVIAFTLTLKMPLTLRARGGSTNSKIICQKITLYSIFWTICDKHLLLHNVGRRGSINLQKKIAELKICKIT